MTTPDAQALYKPGDAVYYYDTGEKGHVTTVTPVTSFNYEVKWDDPDEGFDSGTYPEAHLTSKPVKP